MVAHIAADFVDHFDAQREACWIAERDGANVGSERFARQAGYKKTALWTNSLLLAARGIYTKAGYRLVAGEPHHSFGHDLVGESWELALDRNSPR
jgi:hypothetical protein